MNTSRGGIIDEVALADALMSGHLAGAALDVFEAEPPPVDHVLLSMDNCLFSPHIASFGSRTVATMTDLLVEQINAVAGGRTPPGLVNAPLGPRFPRSHYEEERAVTLDADAIATYRRDGFVCVGEMFTPAEIAAMNDAADEFVDRARHLSSSDEIFDLGPDHRPGQRPAAAHP